MVVTMGPRKVLLADDDPSLRRLVAATLGTENFDLLQATDGPETVAIAQQEHPDLVLLDLNMPGMNGVEVCQVIKSDESLRDVKVMVLTASGNDEDRTRAREAGADDYFIKPFSPVALLDKIYDLFE
jgi:DNA-binding response OmpR family regulator